MSKKVLFVATVVKTHINVFHLPYLQWFQQQGYETHVCAKDDFEGERCIIPYCDKHFNIPFERFPMNKNNIKAYKELKEIINTNNYEIIHCHTPVAAMLTRLAARKSREKGTKVIYTAHGFHFFKGAPLLNWCIYFPIEWICSYLTDILITINREDFLLASQVMKSKKIYYVPGVGIELQSREKIERSKILERLGIDIPLDSKILLSVGELSKRKNHEVVIKAISEIKDENVYFLICGQGDLKNYLSNLSKVLGIEKRIFFLGFRKDILDICGIADIFIFPSLQEGLPVALMEAMSAGVPIICSKVRGNVDLIEEGKGGLLVQPTNVSEMKKSIELLINNEKLRVEMCNFNIKKIQEYDRYLVLKNMSQIYRRG